MTKEIFWVYFHEESHQDKDFLLSEIEYNLNLPEKKKQLAIELISILSQFENLYFSSFLKVFVILFNLS